VKEFFVEVFVPRSCAGTLAAAEERVRRMATRLSDASGEIRYLRAIYVSEDETCFYAFEARSAELVAEACTLAGLSEGRVVETTTVERGGKR
jgi:hypothetical protein